VTPDKSLRVHLTALLQGGHAHTTMMEAFKDWPPQARGAKPKGISHSAWELLEHLRIAQWDIIEFSLSAEHVSPEFPAGYWPDSQEPPEAADWDRSLEQLEKDQSVMRALIADPETDLHARIPHGDGQTVLREALTLASHNSYHVGQVMMLRKLLGIH
jgi:uncharacterized damage-inducible protein DinB